MRQVDTTVLRQAAQIPTLQPLNAMLAGAQSSLLAPYLRSEVGACRTQPHCVLHVSLHVEQAHVQ
jgi:hypothetical protein